MDVVGIPAKQTSPLCSSTVLSFPYTAPTSGDYRVVATLRPYKFGIDVPEIQTLGASVGAQAISSPLESNSTGARAIKAKIVELYSTLHGKVYSVDSEAVSLVYQLFVESWEQMRSDPDSGNFRNLNWSPTTQCQTWTDINIGNGLPVSQAFETYVGDGSDWPYVRVTPEVQEFLAESGDDPQFAKRAWQAVMVFMLSDYDYLYE